MHPASASLLAVSRPALLGLSSAALLLAASLQAATPHTLNLWPGTPPGDEKVALPPENDQTKPEDRLIAGRRIIKLGNVSTPQITVFPAPKTKATGAAIIVAPGGGWHILAYDLEGTEVAEWLNSIGVTAIVLKYRVPFRDKERRWLAPSQDAQRALSIVRSKASEWNIAPNRIGIMGFSAGAHTAAMTAFLHQCAYPTIDSKDAASCRPNFVALIYPGGFVQRDSAALSAEVNISKETPPMFLAHAHDDNVSPLNSALLYLELKKAGVPAELHIYSTGGHGYGLRPTELPVTTWPARMEDWLKTGGWLTPDNAR